VFEPVPPFKAIIDHFKERIIAGRLQPGDTLPTVRAVADQWSVAHATAARAMRELQAEGYAYTSGKTTLVADRGQAELTLRVPVVGTRRRGESFPPDADLHEEITEAGLVVPPEYVSRVLELGPGTPVVRREAVSRRGVQVVRLSVRWYPPGFAESIPEILDTDARVHGPAHIAHRMGEVTGRRTEAGLDSYHSRTADEREARLMKIPAGSPVLARVTTWQDREGVMEYFEGVYPMGVVVSMEYLDSLASLDDEE
jgi:GntR family transcriptional regulator